MKIAITADREIPVPRRLSGGIERIVGMLARGLAARGHDVTLFAHPESRTAGRLLPWPDKASQSISDNVWSAAYLARAVSRRFDVVLAHCPSHADLAVTHTNYCLTSVSSVRARAATCFQADRLSSQ